MKPTLTRILTVSAVAACVAGALCLSACNNDTKPEQKGPVAATLGDRTVYEDEVTQTIETIRSQYGYTEDTIWAMVLQASGLTPADLRLEIIKDMTVDTVIPVAAETMGVTVDPAEVDAAVEKMKSTYGLTDEQWETALTSSGYTEETYRSAVELSMMDSALREEVSATAEVSDEQFMDYGMIYVQYYYNNIKRSSHILFSADDEALAAEVLAKLQSGELSFADAVAQYSIDTGSAVYGGDVGWSGIHSFVTEYQTALMALEPGQMSGLVLSQFGYHIILCTDAFQWTEDTTVADLPEDLYNHVCSNYVMSSVEAEAYSDLLDQTREEMGFTVYDMPEGLSYDVDIEALLNPEPEEGAEGEGTEGEGTEGTAADGEGAVEGEGAAGESADGGAVDLTSKGEGEPPAAEGDGTGAASAEKEAA